MADEKLSENDEDLTIVEVDEKGEPIGGDKPADEKPAEEDKADDQDEHDDEDEGDERLGAHEDENEVDAAERNRKSREQRKLRRERAKAHAEREREELRLMREQNAQMQERLRQLEASTIGSNAAQLAAQRDKLLQDARMADDIRAAAISAGNGADVVQAEQIRDNLRQQAAQLDQQINQYEQARQRIAQPQADPNVTTLAQQWISANPWYDPAGRDADSATAKTIDAQLVKEGFNPATQAYWRELTARCRDAFGDSGEAGQPSQDAPKSTPKAPPLGGKGEHAPPSTRKNEIRVTPERKQAMIDAGVWDDPVQRNRYLKAYRDYDNNSKAN